ncbi:pentapeptide repeat-containing protein [Streptomyces sp. NBC_00287]|uniref:pentapeptide repeat-containing protein n=1 Tax=Streptomyces sp. NBC_00287 TaxID=2975702 RepID=UPI003FA788CB
MYAVSSRSCSTSGCSGPSDCDACATVRCASSAASCVRPALTASLILVTGSARRAAVGGSSPSTASATASKPRGGVGGLGVRSRAGSKAGSSVAGTSSTGASFTGASITGASFTGASITGGGPNSPVGGATVPGTASRTARRGNVGAGSATGRRRWVGLSRAGRGGSSGSGTTVSARGAVSTGSPASALDPSRFT